MNEQTKIELLKIATELTKMTVTQGKINMKAPIPVTLEDTFNAWYKLISEKCCQTTHVQNNLSQTSGE